MLHPILFDQINNRENLLPFTFTRPVSEIRIGLTTLRQKWEYFFDKPCFNLTTTYLQEKFPVIRQAINTYIHSAYVANETLAKEITQLKPGQYLVGNSELIAACLNLDDELTSIQITNYKPVEWQSKEKIESRAKLLKINDIWGIFQHNDQVLRDDFLLFTANKKSIRLPADNTLIGDAIFIEEGAKISCSTLNTTTGPIYIGKNVEIMEGCLLRGPLAIGENSVIKMGTKIYGATTIGPNCRMAGELSNVVVFGYTNKAHDGFLGNAVLGEWCNLGAGTNCSNLKNNYSQVSVYSYAQRDFLKTGLQFCGLMMGDYAKSGINTMFNTGTVIGVSANVFGADFPPKHIPSFSWGGKHGMEKFELEKAFDAAEKMQMRRNIPLTEADKKMLKQVYETDI